MSENLYFMRGWAIWPRNLVCFPPPLGGGNHTENHKYPPIFLALEISLSLLNSPMLNCLADNIHKEHGLLGSHQVEAQLLVDPGPEGDQAGQEENIEHCITL